jgi:microsomal dipeptidase-like Zn-dependent dipeptidase
MLGFSMYPHHLAGKTDCTLTSFCEMIARTADLMGVERIGFGSDLCQDQPDSIVEWMRAGTWSREMDYGEGSAAQAGFPPQPEWFKDNRDFRGLAEGLSKTGLGSADIDKIMGGNWLSFFEASFGPQ